MVTVKVKLRPGTREGAPGRVFYLIRCAQSMRTVSTDYLVYPEDWDSKNGEMKIHLSRMHSEEYLSIPRQIKWDLNLFRQVVKDFSSLGATEYYSASDIVAEFKRTKDNQSFFKFMESVISRLETLEKFGTAQNYRSTLKSFRQFRHDQDVILPQLTPIIIEEYSSWLMAHGICPNTVSFYMRILRAVYNRAVRQGVAKKNNLFQKVFTGNDKTVKRAISMQDIKKIKNLDLSGCPHLIKARDIFLFLFYCRGMSFVDAAYLKISNWNGETIVYRRHKTNQLLTIGVNKHILEIVNKYTFCEWKRGMDQDSFLLPIISSVQSKNEKATLRRLYTSALRRINAHLKEIGKLAKIGTPLTTYVSRHAWASIAKQIGISTSVISDALGHDSEQTTQIYLASISHTEIDRANAKILGFL